MQQRPVISRCQHADCAAMARIEAECFGPAEGQSAWSENSIRSSMQSAGSHCVMARAGDDSAGYAIAREVGAGEAELLRIAVRKEARRMGIGRALISELAASLAEAGCTVLHLELRSANAPALALYESTGFRQTGRRKAYFETGEDAILMKMELGM